MVMTMGFMMMMMMVMGFMYRHIWAQCTDYKQQRAEDVEHMTSRHWKINIKASQQTSSSPELWRWCGTYPMTLPSPLLAKADCYPATGLLLCKTLVDAADDLKKPEKKMIIKRNKVSSYSDHMVMLLACST
jgi:hypothetical protein